MVMYYRRNRRVILSSPFNLLYNGYFFIPVDIRDIEPIIFAGLCKHFHECFMSFQALGQKREGASPGLCVAQAAGETLRGSFCWRLKHCGRFTIFLHTVIISHVFLLDTADGESEICPRPTAYEAIRDPSVPSGC